MAFAGAGPAAAADPQPPVVHLAWPDLPCPTTRQVADNLELLGLEIDTDVVSAGSDVSGEAWVSAVPVGAATEDATVELRIEVGGRSVGRTLDLGALPASCPERGAVIAAIVERAVRPAPSPAPGDAPVEHREFEIELAPQGTGQPEPAPAPEEAEEDVPVRTSLEPLWILHGSLVVLGGEGPTFRGGADAELRYEFSRDLFAVLRVSYRSPRVSRVGTAVVRIDDAWAALGLQIGSPYEAMALQTTAIVQVAWSHGEGLEREYSVVRANPGVTMGACYQKAFETWGFECCVRGFGFLRRQEIHVNDQPVLGLPRVGGELALGVSYQL